MATYFTADSHWGHRLMARLRGFGDDVEAHDRMLVEAWNSSVWPDDVVWHLGDFAWTLDKVREITPQLNGTIYLIAGNHDKCWTRRGREKDRRKAQEAIPIYLESGISRVYDSGSVEYFTEKGKRYLLSHLPAVGDHTTQTRYEERRPPHEGKIICGHVHDLWKVHAGQVNVGVDVWEYRAVLDETVFAAFEEE